MKKKTMMNDKDLSWFLDNQDDEMDNEVIPQTEAQPVPVEETTTDVEMNEDSVLLKEKRISLLGNPSIHGILRIWLFKDVSAPR